MTQRERLRQLQEDRDPVLRLNRFLSEQAVAEAILKLEIVKGDTGYSPIKGEDYYTAEEIQQVIDFIQSQVKDGEQGPQGIQGPRGDRGGDGYTPIRGVDYWTKEDRAVIEKEVVRLMPKERKQDPKLLTDLIEKSLVGIKKTQGDDGLKLTALEKRLIRLGGGGASFLTQLLDVALSSPSNGQVLTFNSTTSKWTNQAAGSGGFTELTATGTVNSINKAFTFIQQPSYLVSDGAWYKKLDNNAGVQWTWTPGTLTATLTIAPQTSLFGIA